MRRVLVFTLTTIIVCGTLFQVNALGAVEKITNQQVPPNPTSAATNPSKQVSISFSKSWKINSLTGSKTTYSRGLKCKYLKTKRSGKYITNISWSCYVALGTSAIGKVTIKVKSGKKTYTKSSTSVFSINPAPVSWDLGSGTNYTYLVTTSKVNGLPVRWQPCDRTITIRTNLGAYSSELPYIQQATAQISAATQIPISIIGSTGFTPTLKTFHNYSGDYDITIAVVDKSDIFPKGPNDYLGYGGPAYKVNVTNGAVSSYELSYGTVAINASYIVPSLGNGRVLLYMHELGHVMGLNHWSDAKMTQVMHPSINAMRPVVWGSGDRAGLASLGKAAGCVLAPYPYN